MAFPDEVFMALGEPKEPSSLRGRSGKISIEALAKLTRYHTVRRISVSTESFGLVDHAKAKVVKRVQKMVDSKPERLARLQEKHPGAELKMIASIHLTPPEQGQTSWSLYIHTIMVSLVGTDQYYPVY